MKNKIIATSAILLFAIHCHAEGMLGNFKAFLSNDYKGVLTVYEPFSLLDSTGHEVIVNKSSKSILVESLVRKIYPTSSVRITIDGQAAEFTVPSDTIYETDSFRASIIDSKNGITISAGKKYDSEIKIKTSDIVKTCLAPKNGYCTYGESNESSLYCEGRQQGVLTTKIRALRHRLVFMKQNKKVAEFQSHDKKNVVTSSVFEATTECIH